MKIKAAIFYKGNIAYYSIYLIENSYFKAKLDSYAGEQTPPLLVELFQVRDRWISDCKEDEVVNELSAALQQNRDSLFQKAS